MTLRCEGGQASVELVGVLPLALLAALAMGQALAAGAAHELAGNAAGAGAVAMLQGADGAAAARSALPGWLHARVDVKLAGRRVTVRVRPPSPFPALADALATSATAVAGPRP